MSFIERTLVRCDDCGVTYDTAPFPKCFRCNEAEFNDFVHKQRRDAVEGACFYRDLYSQDLLVWCGEEVFVNVRDPGMFLRATDWRAKEDAVNEAVRLRDENRELLVENAKLRRALDRKR